MESLKVKELKSLAKNLGMRGYSNWSKSELIHFIENISIARSSYKPRPIPPPRPTPETHPTPDTETNSTPEAETHPATQAFSQV